MRISDWSSDVCSSDLGAGVAVFFGAAGDADRGVVHDQVHRLVLVVLGGGEVHAGQAVARWQGALHVIAPGFFLFRSEEHTSELQSLMRISYAVFCLKKKKNNMHTDDAARATHKGH